MKQAYSETGAAPSTGPIGNLVIQRREIAQHQSQQAGGARLLDQLRFGSQAIPRELDQPVHLGPALLVQDAGEEQHHLAPFCLVKPRR